MQRDTRSKRRDGKTWSGRERNGTGTGNRVIFVPNQISRPSPSLVSVPAVYHPVVRRLGLVPTVSCPTVRPLPDCFPSHRLPSCCFHPIPRSHTILLSRISVQHWGSYFHSIYHRFCRFHVIYMTMDVFVIVAVVSIELRRTSDWTI